MLLPRRAPDPRQPAPPTGSVIIFFSEQTLCTVSSSPLYCHAHFTAEWQLCGLLCRAATLWHSFWQCKGISRHVE